VDVAVIERIEYHKALREGVKVHEDLPLLQKRRRHAQLLTEVLKRCLFSQKPFRLLSVCRILRMDRAVCRLTDILKMQSSSLCIRFCRVDLVALGEYWEGKCCSSTLLAAWEK
jgi:hypothetical protein